MPWDTGLCTSCRNAMEAANARKMDEEKKKRQAQQPQPRAESPTIHYSFTGYFKKHQYKSGNLYSGSMQSGYRHGKGKFTRAEDHFTYDGDWYMGKRHGRGEEEMPGQWRFSGEFYNDQRNGFGKLVCADGESYEGEWEDGKKHSYGRKTYASGSWYEGEWVDGRREGKGVYHNAGRAGGPARGNAQRGCGRLSERFRLVTASSIDAKRPAPRKGAPAFVSRQRARKRRRVSSSSERVKMRENPASRRAF